MPTCEAERIVIRRFVRDIALAISVGAFCSSNLELRFAHSAHYLGTIRGEKCGATRGEVEFSIAGFTIVQACRAEISPRALLETNELLELRLVTDISDWAVELWKTFGNWIATTIKLGLDPSTTRYVLYVTPTKCCPFRRWP